MYVSMIISYVSAAVSSKPSCSSTLPISLPQLALLASGCCHTAKPAYVLSQR
jgi:hypothetical protein